MLNQIKKGLALHFHQPAYLWVVVKNFLWVMLFYSLFRIGFYAYNTPLFPDMTLGKFFTILGGGLRFDLTALIYINLAYIIFTLLPHPWRHRKGYTQFWKWWFFLTNGLMMLLNAYDIIFYPFSLRRTTASIFKEFENETNLFGIFIEGLLDHWWLVLIVGLFFWIFYRGIRRPQWKVRPLPIAWWANGISSVFVLVIVFGLCLAGARGGVTQSSRPITISNAAAYVELPSEMNIVLNTPFAIFRTLGKAVYERKSYFDEAELEGLYSVIHQPADSVSRKYDNVVVFIIESLGREFLGSFNAHLEDSTYTGYTPFLDSLLGVSKPYWFSFANGKKSIDAMPSVLTSIPSIKTPYVLSPYSANKVNGLATILSEEGYQTGFFHGAPNGSMGFDAFASLAGFAQYFGYDEYGNSDDFDGTWGIWDHKFFQYYGKELSQMQEPFFGTLFSVSSHHPYKIPDELEGALLEGPTPLHRCVNYTDQSLKQFFDQVKTEEWFERTLFIITADHSPSHPYYPEYRSASGLFRVPIIFYHPQHPEWGESFNHELIQQIDVMPTVLGHLGYDKPFLAYGRNALDSNQVPFTINYQNQAFQWFEGDWLLQYNESLEKSIGLYAFKQDSLLKENLLGEFPEVEEKMKSRVKAFIQQYHNRILDNDLTIE